MNLTEAADVLLDAEASVRPLEPLTDSWKELDPSTAAAVQQLTLSRRLARGERLTGLKLGLTSRAKQQRMGIDTPITAFLTDAMVLRLGEPLHVDELIHPRAEPEIVFVMGARLLGPGVTAAEALAAVSSVACGVEIIDSRFKDFRFTLADVVADNASAARYVLGPRRVQPCALDLSLEACVVEVDGRVVDSATGAAVQGHPAEALAEAVNTLGRSGIAVEAGWTVLTGGMTDAVELGAGSSLRVDFTNLGSIQIQAVGGEAQ
jgi:2-oxo-3-hexenedioate decarboxylase